MTEEELKLDEVDKALQGKVTLTIYPPYSMFSGSLAGGGPCCKEINFALDDFYNHHNVLPDVIYIDISKMPVTTVINGREVKTVPFVPCYIFKGKIIKIHDISN